MKNYLAFISMPELDFYPEGLLIAVPIWMLAIRLSRHSWALVMFRRVPCHCDIPASGTIRLIPKELK